MSAVFVCIDGPRPVKHLGWTWNPYEQRWQLWRGPGRVLIAPGYDLVNRPRFSPWQLLGGAS